MRHAQGQSVAVLAAEAGAAGVPVGCSLSLGAPGAYTACRRQIGHELLLLMSHWSVESCQTRLEDGGVNLCL